MRGTTTFKVLQGLVAALAALGTPQPSLSTLNAVESALTYPNLYLETMFYRFNNPIFPLCLFANSASYPKFTKFTCFLWILADSTKIF